MAEAHERHVAFPSAGRPAYTLEGVLSEPDALDDAAPAAAALLCHPQPATSSLDDSLLHAVAADLAAAGIVALRFNFRGVGQSEGQQTDGRLEPLDIAGAIEFLLGQAGVNPEKLCLIGHAFGAYMVLAYAAHDPRVGAVVAISPPMFRITPELGVFDLPKLFVTGEHDEVAPRHKLEPWIARLPGPRELMVITRARHLLHGYEATAARAIARYVGRWAAV